jgi:hypothetical protein
LRQRRIRARIASAVRGGSRVQSGSVLRTEASVSVTPSPAKARRSREMVGERWAFDQLHDEHGHVGRVFKVVNGCDIGMIERSQDFGFPRKPSQACMVASEGIRQDFDGDSAAEPGVPGPVHFSHAACADGRNDFVCAEPNSAYQGHLSPPEAGLDYTLLIVTWGDAQVSRPRLGARKRVVAKP